MQMQEEEVDVQALLERERAIRQLEVVFISNRIKYSVSYNSL